MDATTPVTKARLDRLLRSVVKVMTISDAPDYDQPWQTSGTSSAFGSGAIIETRAGLRVVTNAHCVENQVFVEVRRYGKTRKYVAEVEALGHECDLALLRVQDPSFFSGTQPMRLGGVPELSERVSVCGYPVGGDRLSITEGIVSRVEVVQYAQSQRRLLALQVDAAINNGNSGGPVLYDGELVGLAFQTLEDAEQIGYIVAAPVISHFLTDVAEGIIDGFPALGIAVQALEAEAHRRQLGLPAEVEGGVLVTRIAYGGSAWGILEEEDVLLELDGVPLAADGTVSFRDDEQVSYDYLVAQRRVGELLNARVWRDGGVLTCVVPLRAPAYLVAEDRYDVRPSYYVFGGLVFVPLTKDYLKTWGEAWWQRAPRDLVALYEHGAPTPERSEPVVLQKVLADAVNQGYHELESVLITSAQGEPVRSLRHLVERIEDTADTEPFVRLTSQDGRRIVLERAAAGARGPEILRRFGVPHDRSLDLRATNR
ncbi:MAG: trypsin-like peptidase domain-containing protein [Myxococcota bacterium]